MTPIEDGWILFLPFPLSSHLPAGASEIEIFWMHPMGVSGGNIVSYEIQAPALWGCSDCMSRRDNIHLCTQELTPGGPIIHV